MNTKHKVCYGKDVMIKILRDLEVMVVSLHRIGSEPFDKEGGKEEYSRVTTEFIDEWEVTQKLARIRRVLQEQFSDELDEHGTDELERNFADLKFWPDLT